MSFDYFFIGKKKRVYLLINKVNKSESHCAIVKCFNKQIFEEKIKDEVKVSIKKNKYRFISFNYKKTTIDFKMNEIYR